MSKTQLMVMPRTGIDRSEVVQNHLLSWGARGLIVYLLELSVKCITLRQLQTKVKSNGTRRYIGELIRAGYVDVSTEYRP